MCTNEKKPHPWCENTVSHHGVKVAASINPKQIYRKRSNFVQMKRKDMIKRLKKTKPLMG
jgi:hypothetical protein